MFTVVGSLGNDFCDGDEMKKIRIITERYWFVALIKLVLVEVLVLVVKLVPTVSEYEQY